MPNGGTYCITPGIRARSPSCNVGEDEAGARLSTKSAPSNAMIANLISSRSLISPEEGGVSFCPQRRKCLYFHRACGGGSPCSRAPSSVIRSNSFNSLWYFSCFSMVLIKFLIRSARRESRQRGSAAGRWGSCTECFAGPRESLCAGNNWKSFKFVRASLVDYALFCG